MFSVKKISTAILPVAGLGTRFLPATKASPKEMMPIVDKPLIQYAVDEAVRAGITQLIFITSHTKRAIEDHFDKNKFLENYLIQKGETEQVKLLQDILPDRVNCIFLRQGEALGLGHAISCAEDIIGQNPFAIILADDLIKSNENNNSCLQQMITEYKNIQSNLIAVEKINKLQTSQYGVIALSDNNDLEVDRSGKIQDIIEKPDPHIAPSDFGVCGRYILEPEIFAILKKLSKGKNNEIQLTDGIRQLLKSQPVYAYAFSGKRYDCGDKLGYLKAIVEFGLEHREVGGEFSSWLSRNIKFVKN